MARGVLTRRVSQELDAGQYLCQCRPLVRGGTSTFQGAPVPCRASKIHLAASDGHDRGRPAGDELQPLLETRRSVGTLSGSPPSAEYQVTGECRVPAACCRATRRCTPPVPDTTSCGWSVCEPPRPAAAVQDTSRRSQTTRAADAEVDIRSYKGLVAPGTTGPTSRQGVGIGHRYWPASNSWRALVSTRAKSSESSSRGPRQRPTWIPDEVLAQVLDRGGLDAWRSCISSPPKTSGCARASQADPDRAASYPAFWLAALETWAESIDWSAPLL